MLLDVRVQLDQERSLLGGGPICFRPGESGVEERADGGMAPTSAPRLTDVSSAHLRSVVPRGGAKEWVSRCVKPAAPK